MHDQKYIKVNNTEVITIIIFLFLVKRYLYFLWCSRCSTSNMLTDIIKFWIRLPTVSIHHHFIKYDMRVEHIYIYVYAYVGQQITSLFDFQINKRQL